MNEAQTLQDNQNQLPEPNKAPDSQVLPVAKPRYFSALYKARILQKLDLCQDSHERGALLRREGLYASHLFRWRKQRELGTLQALSPTQRGPKAKPANPLQDRVRRLEREKQQLQDQAGSSPVGTPKRYSLKCQT